MTKDIFHDKQSHINNNNSDYINKLNSNHDIKDHNNKLNSNHDIKDYT